LGRAIVGLCINGIIIAWMIISVPIYNKVAERAKEIQQQQTQGFHP
jgi:hypothetical protein